MQRCSITSHRPDILRAPQEWADLYPADLPVERRLASLGLFDLGDRLRFFARG